MALELNACVLLKIAGEASGKHHDCSVNTSDEFNATDAEPSPRFVRDLFQRRCDRNHYCA